MTTPDDLTDACEAFIASLVTELWQRQPAKALAQSEALRSALRIAAAELDPETWPASVRTLLWRPHDHRP